MIKVKLVVIAWFVASFSLGQSFAPPAGQAGSTAISKDSSIIVNWATTCSVTRGFMNISDTTLGLASFGADSLAIGVATGSSVVSLGDRGEAVLTFSQPITNGAGPDFAVFENSFSETFLEFAFVEVSSDGVNFVRFPAVSETQTAVQIDGFGSVDCRYVHNLAGKYKANFGTPFDLDDLIGSPNLNVNAITHVKIIDVVGSINPLYGSIDSQGNYINDPFATPFASSGFDLDAVAVIHEGIAEVNNPFFESVKIYPNPTTSIVTVSSPKCHYTITDLSGRMIEEGEVEHSFSIDLSNQKSGVYFLQLSNSNVIFTERIIKK